MQETDFLVVGAGIVGLSITRELAKRYPGCRVVILEKETQVAFHASGRNSGVLHAGFYYDADSLKARFAVAGNQALTAYCLEHGLPINRCGKVVVASDESEIAGVEELKRRGDRNGVKLHLVDAHELAAIEPNARTCEKALFSPTTSTVAPKVVCRHIAGRLPPTVRLLFSQGLTAIYGNVASTSGGKIRFKYLYNAAGQYADRIAGFYGVGGEYTLIPFKGIYLKYNDDQLLRRHVYPVPNLKNPFLGVHFTKTVDGHVKIGPTAIPAFWRENYHMNKRFRSDEFIEIMGQEARLFLHDSFGFRRLAWEEMRKYLRRHFIRQSRKLVNRLDVDNFGAYTPPGIRAQLLHKKSRRLIMDFMVVHAPGSSHVLNSVSPAFTTAFSFADYVVDQSCGQASFPF